MEKKQIQNQGMEVKAIWILKALLCSYFVTGILLLLLTFLLYQFGLDEGKITVGIMVIYVLSTLVGGFVAGKLAKTRRFLWGILIGVLYFLLLLLISFGIYRRIQEGTSQILITWLLCIGGGMIGGMIS